MYTPLLYTYLLIMDSLTNSFINDLITRVIIKIYSNIRYVMPHNDSPTIKELDTLTLIFNK
jgi:hypothetical protein